MPTAFTATVDVGDWDDNVGGWRCPAIRIPGATVEAVYVSGVRVDTGSFEVTADLTTIRWTQPTHPGRATISIVLTKDFSTEQPTGRCCKAANPIPPMPEDAAPSPRTIGQPIDSSEADGAGLFRVYEEYARALRTWLVAYGIGGPVLLLLTNDVARVGLAKSGQSRAIASAFLLGVALQVLLAALNKAVNWAQYYCTTFPLAAEKRLFKVANWLAEQFWIDLACDLGSLALFGWATLSAFDVLTSAA